MRLRADFWVAAFIRRCGGANVSVYLRRRGAEEAGGVYIKVDRLDGCAALYGPAPQADADGAVERRFIRLHKDPWIEALDVEERLKREIGFDSDIWIIEVDGLGAQTFYEVVD